ncbi:hypothetical protein OPKNFCMD_2190 [Methylobacterium crusticola]|uniref:Uncharacterized protein n=1 Tax=Methylobacterium crusticola TaxID=1697972 RepID=A0ABQ4QX52_9HYPH|nr:hypothetical protein [Methylobacterium crusticola]GJD49460.1 hypothetical protein OPKNFCMD_2190 [Methylobacterium crusticola]
MSLWSRPRPRPTSDPSTAYRSISGRGIAPRGAARAGIPGPAWADRDRDGSADRRDRETSQSLVFAKQFDINGQIG